MKQEYTEKEIAEYKAELEDLVRKFPYNYSRLILTTRRYLLDFVNWMTPKLQDGNYQISTKVYWILHEFKDFPKCRTCGKPIKRNIIITHGHSLYCNSKCANLSQDIQNKIKATCNERYGTDYSTQSEEMKSKARETWKKNYGVDNPSKTEIVRSKLKERMNRIFSDPILGKELKERRINATMKKYGVKNVFQSEEIKEKCKKVKIERYGNPYYSNQKQAEETCIERYGSLSIPKQKIVYDNHSFDSSYELAYYIWLKDHNIEFSHPCPLTFKYIGTDGIEHTYFPDFLVEGIVVEIKGLQFFENKDPSKKLICPFKNKRNKNNAKSKWECMKEHNVTIITNEEIKPYINYVKEKYGKDFLKSCKIKKI